MINLFPWVGPSGALSRARSSIYKPTRKKGLDAFIRANKKNIVVLVEGELSTN